MTTDLYDVVYEIHDEKEIESISKSKVVYDNGYVSPYIKACNKILDIYDKGKINNMDYKIMREISYNIIKNNLRINYFYYTFLSLLLEKTNITDKKKFKIIEFVAGSQYSYIKSYRSLIIIESLLINTFNLLTT